jgi:uncharacterized protein (UPF0147 family)
MKSLTVSRFYLELTLQEYEFVTESQSSMAAACLWIAMSTLGFDSTTRTRPSKDLPGGSSKYLKKYWSDQLTYYTGLQEWEVVPLAQRIARVVRATQSNLRHLPAGDESEEFENNEMCLNNSLEDSTSTNSSQLCKVVYNKYASSVFFKVAAKTIIDDASIEKHIRRVNSEKIDFEATQEPNSKRRSTGCTTKLQKMSLRSNTPNIPVKSRPRRGQNKVVKDGVVKPTDEANESTKFFSAKSQRPEENKEN